MAQTVAAGVHELGRRQVAGHRVNRPILVVQVELGHIGDQIHVCIVELLNRTDVAPVSVISGRGARNLARVEVVDAGLVARSEVRGDVAAHVVLGVGSLLIERQSLEQGLGVGNVVTHGSQNLVRIVRQTGGGGRLLLEVLDHVRVIGIDLNHTELVRFLDGLADTGHGELSTGLDVLLNHLFEVHAVDVVGTHYHHDVRLDILDDVDGLVDGVGGAEIPMLAETLLRGHRGDVRAKQRGETPDLGDVAVKRVRLVLGEHHDLTVPGVHQIAQREIDQTIHTTEGNGGLRAIAG